MKILLYDIETTPNLGYTWGKWEQNVISFKEEWKLLSFSYKELGKKRVHSFGLNTMSEKALVKKLHKVLSSADILVAHNGDEFDAKKANAKFIQFGLAPATPSRAIDTKKEAKRHFKFTSNSLDDLGTTLKVGRKVKTGGFDLWLACMSGDASAWKKMLRYNAQDVRLLERVYLKLRPYMKSHPNVASVLKACPKCGSTHLQSRGILANRTARYRSFQCQQCGGWSRARLAEKAAKPEVV